MGMRKRKLILTRKFLKLEIKELKNKKNKCKEDLKNIRLKKHDFIPDEMKATEAQERSNNLSDDIRYVKDQQWRVLYYALLGYAVIIASYKILTISNLRWIKILLTIAIVLIGIASVLHQIINTCNLNICRIRADGVEDYLDNIVGVRGKIEEEVKPKFDQLKKIGCGKKIYTTLLDKEKRSSAFFKILFPILFCLIISVGVFISLFIVWDC